MELDNYREVVHSTIKDLMWVHTKISEDHQNIDIIFGFGNIEKFASIKVKDVISSRYSCKAFVGLISESLEAVFGDRDERI